MYLSLTHVKKDVSFNDDAPENKVALKEQRNLSAEERVLRQKLRHVSYLFAEALKDKSFRKDLNLEIAAKLKTTTNDEALSFAEIMGTEDKKLNQISDSREGYRINTAFAKSFLDRINKVHASGKYHKAEEFSFGKKGTTVKDAFMEDGSGGTVYYPYSENFNLDPALTNYTITSHPIDNSDENEGIVWNPSTGIWDYVIVDDAYAYTHPTYIITVDDGPTPANVTSSPFIWEFPETMANPPASPPNTSGMVHFAKLHLEKQAEGLFDGASEIVLIRPLAVPKLDVNGQLNTVDFTIGQMVSIPKIKRGKIKAMKENPDDNVHVGASFITSWKSAYQEVPMVIYEYDQGANLSFEIPTISYKKGDNTISAGGKFAINIPSRKTPYVADLIDRDGISITKTSLILNTIRGNT